MIKAGQIAKKNVEDQVKEMELLRKKKFGIWCK